MIGRKTPTTMTLHDHPSTRCEKHLRQAREFNRRKKAQCPAAPVVEFKIISTREPKTDTVKQSQIGDIVKNAINNF